MLHSVRYERRPFDNHGSRLHRAARKSGPSRVDLRSLWRHREYRLDAGVVKIAKTGERTNPEQVDLALRSDDIILDVNPNDATNDDMSDLIG